MAGWNQSSTASTWVRRHLALPAALVTLCVMLLLTLAAVVYLKYFRPVYREVDAIEARLRSQGLPVSPADVDAMYPLVDDAMNAALVYEEAFRLLEKLEFSTDDIDIAYKNARATPGCGITAEARSIITEAGPLLDLCAKASKLPQARYSVDLTTGIKSPTAHVLHIHTFGRILALAGYEAVGNHDINGAMSAVEQMISLAESLRAEPTVTAQLARTVVLEHAYRLLHATIRSSSIQEYDLILAEALLAGLRANDTMRHAIAGERAFLIRAIRETMGGRVAVKRSGKAQLRIGRYLPWNRVEQKRHERSLYREYDALSALVETSIDTWPEAMSQIRRRCRQAPKSHHFVKEMLPKTLDVLDTQMRGEASFRLLRLIVALERYRWDHGTTPETLDGLVPEYLDSIPNDPFVDAPLRYQVRDEKYVVYSVYRDRVDDGGVRAKKDDDGNWHGDWAFEVRR